MKKILIFFGALTILVGLSGIAVAAPVLSFDFSIDKNITLDPNGLSFPKAVSFDIFAVTADDTSPAVQYELQSFGFLLSFDAALLDVTAASVSSAWNFGAPKVDFSTDGQLVMAGAYFNFVPPPFGIGSPALLGSVTFECQGPGFSDLIIFDTDFGGSTADFALAGDFAGSDLDDQISNGLVIGSINNVPIPGSALLLGSGLLGLLGWRRRKRV